MNLNIPWIFFQFFFTDFVLCILMGIQRDQTTEVYGHLGNIIGVAEIVYSSTHSPVGLICSPATVRAILHDSCLFRTDEVNQWNKSIDTPYRIDLNRHVFEIAREEGLAYKAGYRYAEPIDISENPEPVRWARNGWYLKEYESDSDYKPEI